MMGSFNFYFPYSLKYFLFMIILFLFLGSFLKCKYFLKIIKLINILQTLLEEQLIPLEDDLENTFNAFKPQEYFI